MPTLDQDDSDIYHQTRRLISSREEILASILYKIDYSFTSDLNIEDVSNVDMSIVCDHIIDMLERKNKEFIDFPQVMTEYLDVLDKLFDKMDEVHVQYTCHQIRRLMKEHKIHYRLQEKLIDGTI